LRHATCGVFFGQFVSEFNRLSSTCQQKTSFFLKKPEAESVFNR
jgi:hypothetical protein